MFGLAELSMVNCELSKCSCELYIVKNLFLLKQLEKYIILSIYLSVLKYGVAMNISILQKPNKHILSLNGYTDDPRFYPSKTAWKVGVVIVRPVSVGVSS